MEYQKHLEDMMSFPLLLKVIRQKLQEETDMRVLAEETRDAIEREIKKVCIKKKK